MYSIQKKAKKKEHRNEGQMDNQKVKAKMISLKMILNVHGQNIKGRVGQIE